MNYQRRTFLRNIGVAMLLSPLTANLTLGNQLLDFNDSELIPSVLKKLKDQRYELLYGEAFMLNENCRAIPMMKQSTLFGDEKSLLILMDDDSHFILNGEQVAGYNDFISNFKVQSTQVSDNLKVSVSKRISIEQVTTPFKILETNSNNDFRFENGNGIVIEVHASKNKNFVRVLG